MRAISMAHIVGSLPPWNFGFPSKLWSAVKLDHQDYKVAIVVPLESFLFSLSAAFFARDWQFGPATYRLMLPQQ